MTQTESWLPLVINNTNNANNTNFSNNTNKRSIRNTQKKTAGPLTLVINGSQFD